MQETSTLISSVRVTWEVNKLVRLPWQLDVATSAALEKSLGDVRPVVFVVEGMPRNAQTRRPEKEDRKVSPAERKARRATARTKSAPDAAARTPFDRLGAHDDIVDNLGHLKYWRSPSKFLLRKEEVGTIGALDTPYSRFGYVINSCTALLKRALGSDQVSAAQDPPHWKRRVFVLGVSPKVLRDFGRADAPSEPEDAALFSALFAKQKLPVDERLMTACPGKSQLIKTLHQLALRVAPEAFPVLISGENGVGKRHLAMAIHELGKGSKAPFERLDCDGYLRERELESALFGIAGPQRGTPGLLKRAAAGTLYVANIDQLPLPFQIRLRDAILEGHYRRRHEKRSLRLEARLLISSSSDLAALVEADRFDALLYYDVLRACPIEIPSLRERPEDIGTIVKQLWPSIIGKAGTLSRSVIAELEGQNYRGNLRELRAVLRAIFRLVGPKPTPPQARFVLSAGQHGVSDSGA